MAGSKSNYLENALLNHTLRNVAYTPPSAVYAAAFTVAPGESSGGTEVATTGGTLYNRVAITFSAASGGATANSADLSFPKAGASWGTIVGIAIMDSATPGAGNVLYYDASITSKAIDTGDTLVIETGGLTVSED